MGSLGRPLEKVTSDGFEGGNCFSELEIRGDEAPFCFGPLNQPV